MVGLNNRIFFNYEEFSKSNIWKEEIDYEEVEKKLSIIREQSWQYLKTVISKIQR